MFNRNRGVKILSNIVNNVVEDYIRETLKDTEGLLKELEIYAEENSVPIVHKEVADLLEKERKEENCSISQYRYYVKYTLDLNDYISRTYLLTNNSPESILKKSEEVEKQKLNEDIQMKNTEIIFCILDELNPIAKKRFLEYALEGKKIVEIAKEENVNHSSISRSLNHTRKSIIKKLDKEEFENRLLHMGIILFLKNESK